MLGLEFRQDPNQETGNPQRDQGNRHRSNTGEHSIDTIWPDKDKGDHTTQIQKGQQDTGE